jgi:hypothetical protein
MNSTNFPSDRPTGHDALFDQIERELAALTHAPLEAATGGGRRCVDEFSNDFLNWSMPSQRDDPLRGR